VDGWTFDTLLAKIFLALLPDLEALARKKAIPNPPKVEPPPIDGQEQAALAEAKKRQGGG